MKIFVWIFVVFIEFWSVEVIESFFFWFELLFYCFFISCNSVFVVVIVNFLLLMWLGNFWIGIFFVIDLIVLKRVNWVIWFLKGIFLVLIVDMFLFGSRILYVLFVWEYFLVMIWLRFLYLWVVVCIRVIVVLCL